ncbi:MAG: hypothetical protein P9L99_17720 [Candidatus Lernaella stagnicola]|nr:hypothetical protein [Candidatus Lernaella stagnicola]
MRRLALFAVFLTVFFCVGCKHVTDIDPEHGLPGSYVVVTASDDAFKNCDSNTEVSFYNTISGGCVPAEVHDCMAGDYTHAEFIVPDNLPDTDQSKKYIVALSCSPRSDETQVFMADICAPFSTAGMTQKEIDGKDYFDTNFVNRDGAVLVRVPDVCGPGGECFSSERQGLAMMYYALAGDCEQYVKTRDFMEEYMMSEYDLLHWALDSHYQTEHDSSASIDDLKALEAVRLAIQKFGNPHDTEIATRLNNALIDYEILDVGGDPYFTEGASWDAYGVITDDSLPLCYANLPAMSDTMSPSAIWMETLLDTGAVIVNGEFSSNIGLYKFGYDYLTSTYYDYHPLETDLNGIYQALTGMNLTAYNTTLAQENLDFWISQWDTYGIIAGHFLQDGTPNCIYCSDISIYALVAQLADVLDDAAFCNTMIGAIPQAPCGAFSIDPAYTEFGSYGNTLALIALVMERQP